ncbi:MAG: class I SAM-dependent methyltransferase [Caulobacteraceae bacterium]|nr:class I SAM-dependent methyltransferase [Caulobacteraceae bacterium]
MRSKAELLEEVNRDLPDLDWKKGAEDYLQGFFERHTRQQITEFVFAKPLGLVTPEDPEGSLMETFYYLTNFANAIQLLKLKRGQRVLDVACGGGWFAHWLRKLGYDARGMDISQDFIALARERLLADPPMQALPYDVNEVYTVHDFEADRLPEALRGTFDAIVLESCLHHFYDPVAAMTHIVEGLAPGGVVLILEGENRKGAIREEYMQVMVDTATLERPYPRPVLQEILAHAGLSEVEFLGACPGYFTQSEYLAGHFTDYLRDSTEGSNVCVAARAPEAIARVVPNRNTREEAPPPPPPPEPAPAGRPSLLRRIARRLLR